MERKTIRGLKREVHAQAKITAAKYDLTVAQAYELAMYCLKHLEEKDKEVFEDFLKKVKEG